MVLPNFIVRWLGLKAGDKGRGRDGGADARLGWQRKKAVVASDGEQRRMWQEREER
jgi:hypothetical protein